MNLKHITALAASVLALNAGATTTNWGAHDPLEVGVGLVSPGAFSDTFSFSLLDVTNLVSTTVANNLASGGILGITSGTVNLYKEAGVVDQLVGSYAFSGTSGDATHSFLSLLAGDYYYQVSGSAQGSLGGFYALSSAPTAPIPEPETYAMLLAGLIACGVMYRRRSS